MNDDRDADERSIDDEWHGDDDEGSGDGQTGDRGSGDAARRSDPLLANPVLATGHTGEMPRPGDDRSPWVIGLLLAAFASLISGLVTVALTRDDGADPASDAVAVAIDGEVGDEPRPVGGTDDSATDTDTATDTDVPPTAGESADDSTDDTAGTVGDGEPSDGGDGEGAGEDGSTSDPVSTDSPTSLDGRRLPAPGFAVVGTATVPVVSACEVHLPLAPADNDVQLSSYFVRSPSGEPLVIDRRFSGDGDAEVRLGGRVASSVVVDSDAVRGAFVADFGDDGDDDALSLVVNPDPAGGTACEDTVVTNEPGQIAFPHTRVVMASCASGSVDSGLFTAGVTSDGGSFTALDNADGTVSLTYLDDEVGSELIDPSASVSEADGRLGYSGLVTNGVESLDITIDLTPDRTNACASLGQL